MGMKVLLAALLASLPSVRAHAASIKVLTLNVKLDAEGRAPAVAELIRKTGADVVGLQETDKSAEEIAKTLNLRRYRQDGGKSILTRFEQAGTLPGGQGVLLRLEDGKRFAFVNVHLYYEPYQPYQLLGIPYMDAPFLKTEAEAVAAARKARGKDVKAALQAVKAAKDLPLIVVGDFNEPSHLDWTEAAAKAGRHPLKVSWPATKAFAEAGLEDAFRRVYPDEMAFPGFTWTPTTSPDDKKDHHDRIDFVLYRGALQPKAVDVVGESPRSASVVVDPYPTDHRGVLAEFELQVNR